jgi:transposase-like protein
MARYSAQFRNNVLWKVLPPENRSVHEVSKETGVSVQTIHTWMRKVHNGTYSTTEGAENPKDRSLKEKFNLLLEYSAIQEGQTGEWLRDNGVHSEYIPLWEQELRDFMGKSEDQYKNEVKELKKDKKELEKELERKEKALAEMTALVTLKKKLNTILGEKEDD